MTHLFSSRGRVGAFSAGLCLLTGACTHGDGSSNASLEQSIAAPRSQQMMALATPTHTGPVVTLPDAGSVQSVRAHDYVNGFRQDILLQGEAVKGIRNSITVLARTTRQQTLDEQVPLYEPTEAAIRSELGAQFPHVSMQVVTTRASSNAYGPYGFALGRAGGDARCVYMWQWIDENRIPREAAIGGPMSVRVRLCQAGTTFDSMAALLDHLTIGAGSGDGVDDQARVVTGPTDIAPRRVRHAAAHRRGKIVKRDPDGADAPAPESDVMHYPTPARAQAASSAMPDTPMAPAKLASDLPPEATMGPKAGAAKAY